MKFELYNIYDKSGVNYYYTNNVEDVTVEGQLYTAQSISRNEIEIDGEKDDLELTAPISLQPFNEYILLNPLLEYWFNIYSYTNDIKTLIYSGKIVSVSYDSEKYETKAKCASLITIMSSKIPIKRYSSSCPFNLFDEDCGVNKNTYKNIITPADWYIIDDTSIKIDNLTFNKSFTNGYFEINGQILYVINHTAGNVITFLYPILDQTDTVDIEAYYGCNKTISDCNNYNNKLKFGGFPYIPTKNPYTSGF